jgi:hypothetical protein
MNLKSDLLPTNYDEDFEVQVDDAIDDFFAQNTSVKPSTQSETKTGAETAEKSEQVKTEPSSEPTFDILRPVQENLLTLDWEINNENIKKFERELELLGEKFGINPHSRAVIKMALVVCKYLRVKKGSALPLSMQFLHEATRILQLFWEKPRIEGTKRKELLDRLRLNFRMLKVDVKRKTSEAALTPQLRSEQASVKNAGRVATESANEPLFTYIEEVRVRTEAEPVPEPPSPEKVGPKIQKTAPRTAAERMKKEQQQPNASMEVLFQVNEMQRQIERIVQSVKQIVAILENSQGT